MASQWAPASLTAPGSRDEFLDSGEGRLHRFDRLLAGRLHERVDLLLGDVRQLPDARPALDRLELVAPHATAAEQRAEASGQAGLPRDQPNVLELHDLVHHRV